MVLNENIRKKILDMNNCLIDELKKFNDEKGEDNKYFVEKILWFLNNFIDDIRIKQFSDIVCINMWLTTIDDMKELIKFNEKVNDDLSNSFIFEEIDNDLCFIKEEDFVDFVKSLTFDDEEIVELNNYLINLLYLKE